MLTDPQTIQIVQPIDVTQIAIALITTLGGALTFWLTGRRVGRGEARMAAVEKRVSEHAELATSAATTAERHAATAVQVTSMFPRPAIPFGFAGDVAQVESLPPSVLESDPPASMGQIPREPPRPDPPVDRPTPKDRSVR